MSLYGMMRTGVSGMNAQSNRLGTVADNIANSGTTGYKRSSTEFSTLVLPSGSGSYSSGAVQTSIRTAITDQGLLQFTTSALDLAIQGEGFFIVSDASGKEFLTRAGSFVEDKNGYFVNAAGYFLMVDDGNGGMVRAQIDRTSEQSDDLASTMAQLGANLPQQAEIGEEFTRSVVIYDSYGGKVTVPVRYEKTADNQWEVTVNGSETMTLSFNSTGGLDVANSQLAVDINGQQIMFDFAATSQMASEYRAIPPTVDGYEAGLPDEIEIGPDGRVTSISASGASRFLFEIPLARVQSPNNLAVLAGNVFQLTQASGTREPVKADSGGMGKIVSGALENSNVDIAEELTAMIESQRNYTANSKVFQTGSELLDVLVNLKR